MRIAKIKPRRRFGSPTIEALEGRALLSTITSLTPTGPLTVAPGDSLAGTDLADLTTSDNLTTGFVASIDWGDGSTTPASITEHPTTGAELAGFVVGGSHVYGATGDYTATISVSDTDGAVTKATDAISVSASGTTSAPPTVVDLAGLPLSTAPGVPNSGVSIARFTSPDSSAGDFRAVVAWGDGTTSATTVTREGPAEATNIFDVDAAHTYAKAGRYTATVAVVDPKGVATSTTAAVAVVGESISVTGHPFGAFPGVPAPFLDVADFSDAADLPASAYTAAVDWGDGTSSVGRVYRNNPIVLDGTVAPAASTVGGYYVDASHTYAKAGDYAVRVFVVGSGGAAANATTSATVGPLVVLPSAPSEVVAGVATTIDATASVPGTRTGSLAAAIDYGDGSAPVGLPAALTGEVAGIGSQALYSSAVIVANHTYAKAGTYTAKFTVIDPTTGLSQVASIPVVVGAAESLSASGLSIGAFPGVSTGLVQVGSFGDGAGLPASAFTAAIDWGDGTDTAGTVSQVSQIEPAGSLPGPGSGPGNFAISGTHTYAKAGDYAVRVFVVSSFGASANATGSVAVGPLVVLPVVPDPAVSGVATMIDAYASVPGTRTGSLAAAIDYGDGSAPVGLPATLGGEVAGVGSTEPYTTALIRAGHTYAKAGTYAAKFTVIDPTTGVGRSATIPVVVAAGETLTTIPFTSSGVTGLPLRTPLTTNPAILGRVTTTATGAAASDYSAVVSWGDGSTTASDGETSTPGDVVSIVQAGAMSFYVEGSHAYAKPGSYTITVQFVNKADGVSTTFQSDATIATEVLSLSPASLAPVAGSPIGASGATVATFTSSDPLSLDPSRYTASIDWGDGSAFQAGQVTESTVHLVAVVFSVSGQHTYAKPGTYQVGVTVAGPSDYQTIYEPVVVSSSTPVAAPLTSTSAGSVVIQPGANTLTLGTVSATNTALTAGQLRAFVDYGDGTRTALASVVRTAAGQFRIVGRHVYSKRNVYLVTVGVYGPGGISTTFRLTASDFTSTPVVPV